MCSLHKFINSDGIQRIWCAREIIQCMEGQMKLLARLTNGSHKETLEVFMVFHVGNDNGIMSVEVTLQYLQSYAI